MVESRRILQQLHRPGREVERLGMNVNWVRPHLHQLRARRDSRVGAAGVPSHNWV